MALTYDYESTRPSRIGVTFTWEIISMIRRSSFLDSTSNTFFNDVVLEVEWKLKVSEIKNLHTFYHDRKGIVSLSTENLDSMIEYSSLTEEQVISWVKDKLNQVNFIEGLETDYITRLEDELLSELRTGTIKSFDLPWIK